MSGITKEIDVLKQLFSNLSETDKQQFLTSVTQQTEVKKSSVKTNHLLPTLPIYALCQKWQGMR